jgi:hypothetical protein
MREDDAIPNDLETEIFGSSLLGRTRAVNALVFLDSAQIVGPRFVREQPRP